MALHKTSAAPLAAVYAGLIVYASLYPFVGLRDQGIVPWAFLTAPWPRYWTWFDLSSNFLGYVPLGVLVALGLLRTRRAKARYAMALATVLGGLLSLVMETLQSYLPTRVPSTEDLALNFSGAALGALMASLLERLGVLERWSQFRARWFVPDSRGALVLLALWPVALLFPPAVPFGLGQVYERLEAALADVFMGTPFLEWLPLRELELQPLLPLTEALCVTLGALIPCLLAYGIATSRWRRLALALQVLVVGMGVSVLSAALSYGPQHAWAWFSQPVEAGFVTAAILALALAAVPRRMAGALALLGLGIYLSLLNQAPASAYFAQTLQTWEQGRFIRFHGLAQWVGWVWPYAALVYLLLQVAARDPKN